MFRNLKYYLILFLLFLAETQLPIIFPLVGSWFPPLSFLFAFFLTLSSGEIEGFKLGLLLGLCNEIFASTPFGLTVIAFSITLWIAGQFRDLVFLESPITQVVTPVAGYLFLRSLLYIAASISEGWGMGAGGYWRALATEQMLSVAILGPLFYTYMSGKKWVE